MTRAATLLSVVLALTTTACDKDKEVDPTEAAAKLARDLEEADARLRNNKIKDAEKIYLRVLEAQPDNAQALAGLGKVRFEEGNDVEAEKHLRKSVELAGDIAENHAMLGRVYEHMKNSPEAAKSFGRAFELDREKSEYGLPYGVHLKEAGQYEEAEKILREVAELDPRVLTKDGSGVYTQLGDVLREKGQDDEALKTYMKALSTYASDKMAHAGAAFIYEKKGDNKHALDEWSSYIRMDCCSEFSNEVAKKKVMELQVPDGTEDEAGGAEQANAAEEDEGDQAG